VDRFLYLGQLICGTGSLAPEHARRAAAAHRALGALDRRLWSSPAITMDFRRQLFRALIEPVLLYAAESWASPWTTKDLISSTYMRCARRITGLTTRCVGHNPDGSPRFETPPQDLVLRTLGIPSCADIRRQRHLRLAGQVYRATTTSLLATLQQPLVPPRRIRGRQQHLWLSTVTAEASSLQLSLQQSVHIAGWRAATKALPPAPLA
jgi:hypothetical protein